jgi:ABC-type transport system substrate-binding protein
MIRVIASCTCVALLLTACAKPSPLGEGASLPRHGGTLRIATYGNIATLDPALVTDVQEIDLVTNLYQRLVRYDRSGLGQLVPEAAQSFIVKPDGVSYEFQLRRDLAFSSLANRPLKAFDVKASIERALSPDISRVNGNLAAQLQGLLVGVTEFLTGAAGEVSGIQVLNARAIRFVLEHPSPHFLPLLASPAASIIPAEAAAASGVDLSRNPVGSGPFQLQSWNESGIKLVPNSGWPGRVYLDAVHFMHQLSFEEARVKLWSGDLDIAILRSPDELMSSTRGNPSAHGVQLIHQYYLATEWLAVNTKSPPLNNVDFRRALLWATDNRTTVHGNSRYRGLPMKGIIRRV